TLVISSRKMQLKAQCLRGLFSLTLVLLLHSWFVTNVNAYPVQLINPWIIGPLQILRKGCNAYGLSVYHEHMRPDRNEYINIIWENMRKEDEFNFELLNNSIVTNYGLLYDYDSIMHYSMTAFSTNRSLPTIIPKIISIFEYNIKNIVSTNKLKEEPLNKPKKQKKLPKRKKFQDTTVVKTKINHKCKHYK
ncbi:TLL2 protein, partial [Acromyrmex charruanus]